MLHFPDHTESLVGMSKPEKQLWLKNVDLVNTNFEIKIADFGLFAPTAGRPDGIEGKLTTKIGTYDLK